MCTRERLVSLNIFTQINAALWFDVDTFYLVGGGGGISKTTDGPPNLMGAWAQRRAGCMPWRVVLKHHIYMSLEFLTIPSIHMTNTTTEMRNWRNEL